MRNIFQQEQCRIIFFLIITCIVNKLMFVFYVLTREHDEYFMYLLISMGPIFIFEIIMMWRVSRLTSENAYFWSTAICIYYLV